MADREPTVIERMAAAAHNNSASFRAWSHLDAESRACCCDDMLAAVRELKDYCMERDGRASVQITDAIRDHERRSDGKRQ